MYNIYYKSDFLNYIKDRCCFLLAILVSSKCIIIFFTIIYYLVYLYLNIIGNYTNLKLQPQFYIDIANNTRYILIYVKV